MPRPMGPSVTGEPGIYSKKRKFGVSKTSDNGLFGTQYSMFGVGQLDPFAQQNAPHIASANTFLAAFVKLAALIPSLPSSAQRDAAKAIIDKGWYSQNILGIGGETLSQLAASISNYVKEPSQQFVRISSDGKGISNARVEKLEAFTRGVKELQNYMNQFIVQPVEIRTQERVVTQTVPGPVQTVTKTVTQTIEKIPTYVYIVGGVAVVGLLGYFLTKR